MGLLYRVGFVFLTLVLSISALHSQDTYTSVRTGSWGSPSTWTGAGGTPGSNDNVIIQDGHTVSISSGSGENISSITIMAGGVLDLQNRKFSVAGDFIIDGTITSNDNGGKDLDFSGSILGGTGIIALNTPGSVFNINSDAEIPSNASLSVFADVAIGNNVTVTNRGHLKFYGALDGADSSGSVWTNEADSKVEAGGIFMSTGILNASSTGNTVTYTQAGAQSIKTPSASTYYNLVISGMDVKTMLSSLVIDNNISINSGTLDCAGNDLEIHGNWSNQGEFLENTGNVVFNGISDQSIENPAGEIYYDFVADKNSGQLFLENNIQVLNTLSMTNGVIDAGIYTVTLGSDIASIGSLNYTTGHIFGSFERWIDAAGVYEFPVGSSSNEQIVEIVLNGLNSGGTLLATFIDSDGGNSGLPLLDSPDSVYNEFVDGYWSVDVGNGFKLGGPNDYDIQLDANGFSSFTIDGSTRVLTRSDSNGDWLVDGTHVTPVGSLVGRSGVGILPAEYALGDTSNCSRPVTSSISGLTEICTGEAGVSYSVSDNTPNSYTWEITGGTQVSGGTGSSITVDWGSAGMVDGNVRVTESNTCTKGVAVDLPVFIHTVAPEIITGRLSVAENTSGEPYMVDAISDYTYNWTITGGTQVSGGTTNSITVDWGSNGTGYVSVVAQKAGCSPSQAVQAEVNKYVIIESVRSGNWTTTSTWDCACVPLPTDNVRINTSHTVRLTSGGAGTEVNNFIIAAGGALNPNNRSLTIHGNFELDGTYQGGTKSLSMDGFGTYIDGVGNLEQGISISADVYFAATATIDITSGDLDIGAGVTVSNFGSLSLTDNLLGSSIASKWVNKTNASLQVGGDLLSGNGILDASSIGNTVYYTGLNTQEVKVPQSSYYNLTTAGGGSKTLGGSLDINGTLTIDGSSILDVVSGSNYTISLAGDWINLGGTFNEQMGTVILDGLLNQHITGSVTFYDLVYNNSSDLHLNNNVIVSDNLTMSGGNILPQGNMLTIGTGPISPGNIAYTSGTVLGKLERWVNLTATPYLFPIGNVNDYRPAILTFNNLSSGSLIMEFLDGDPGASGLPVSEDGVNVIQAFTEGYWNALPDNSLSSDSYNIQLTATNFTSNAIIPGTRILKRISGGDWTLEGMHMAAVPPDLYRNGLDQGIDASGIQFGVGHVLCSGLSIDRIISDVSCNGDNDGAIDITVNGGTAPYTFSWSHGPDTEDVSALFAGDYTVGVSDNSGCTIDSTFTVTEPLQLSANLNSLPVSCAGGNDGSITISAPVGGSGSYEYSIDGGTSWFATGSFNNLTTAVYNVQMRDALAPACILILNAALDLTTPDDLIPPTAICRDITAPLDISGNVTITTLDVDNGSNDNCGIASMSLDVASFTCADIGNNTVTLTVLDASGNSDFCSSTVTVLDNIAPVISDCPANITVQADTSYCGTTVTWSEPTATDNCPGLVLISTHNPGDFFPVGTTTVSYTATDASGLTDVCSFDIIVEAPASPVINGPTSVCTPSRESYMVIDPGSHSFLWTVTNGTISGSNNNSIVEVDWTGAVQGSVELTISSGTGCSVSASSTVDKSLTPTVGNINSSSSLIRR